MSLRITKISIALGLKDTTTKIIVLTTIKTKKHKKILIPHHLCTNIVHLMLAVAIPAIKIIIAEVVVKITQKSIIKKIKKIDIIIIQIIKSHIEMITKIKSTVNMTKKSLIRLKDKKSNIWLTSMTTGIKLLKMIKEEMSVRIKNSIEKITEGKIVESKEDLMTITKPAIASMRNMSVMISMISIKRSMILRGIIIKSLQGTMVIRIEIM